MVYIYVLVVMRQAGNKLRDLYINNEYVQDLVETLAGAGIAAGGQALFTDMSAEDIAKSTALGAAVALAARPIGGFAGRKIGRAIDTAHPHALDGMAKFVPVTREGSAAMLKSMRKGGGSNHEVPRAVRDMLKAKRNLSAPDAGNSEAILGYYLRNRADNLAQGAIAFGTPFFVGGEEESTV